VGRGVVIALLVVEGVASAQAGPPPVEAPTRATFVSTSARQWDVAVDGQPVCSTPCTFQLFPLQFVTLRSQAARPVLVDVGRLPAGDLIVAGKPLETGMYAGGIVATTLGGMALAVGITLTAVGYGQERDGMATAGLISGAAGIVALTGGIYLMIRALPAATVGRAAPLAAAGTAMGVAARF
jgi:hypothetical protein